jgi:glycosyltransferase involved in cell wall biosynthesis
MNVLFITTEGFPSGMAQTNRILSLAQGLVQENLNVNVLVARPTERKKNQINFKNKGIIYKIKYQYSLKNIIWPEKKHNKLFILIYSTAMLFFYLIRNRKNYQVLIICNPRPLIDLITKILFINKKVVLAVDEFPEFERERNNFYYFFKMFNSFAYKSYDGFVVMTNTLLSYYIKIARKNAYFVHIPMTVDYERFANNNEQSPIKEIYIAYCGNLGQSNKDGVPILLEAFSYIKPYFKDIKLAIIGGTKPSEENKILSEIKNCAQKYGIENDLIITGKIAREEIPKYLNNAKLHALARPDSVQARGGFPTKLGEYLSTGKPVVVTNVGEISKYLTDNKNAYIAKPNDAKDFANKLKSALENEDDSAMVGKKGQLLAKKVFNYKKQGKKLSKFLKSIIS